MMRVMKLGIAHDKAVKPGHDETDRSES